MFELSEFNNTHCVAVESIDLGTGSLHFGCVNCIFWVGLAFCSIISKLSTAQQSTLKLVEIRLYLVDMN